MEDRTDCSELQRGDELMAHATRGQVSAPDWHDGRNVTPL